MPKQRFKKVITLDQQAFSQRLDQALSNSLPEVSRSKLQDWIKRGDIHVNGKTVTKTRYKLAGGEVINVDAEIEVAGDWEAQSLPLDIVFEDQHVIVVNKSDNCVVHPAAGNPDGTLVNALLHHDPELRHLPRAGIIHRLDKDTTGLLVVARSLEAHTSLVYQLQQRAFEREYQCITHGQMVAGGMVDRPIARHPQNRLQMSVLAGGKEAITHYRLIEKFNDFTHLQVNLETGRTHQIRVHMAYLKFPLVGDPLYGKRNHVPTGSSDCLKLAIRNFQRQALHARKLGFQHPVNDEWLSFEVAPPTDYLHLLSVIRQENPV